MIVPSTHLELGSFTRYLQMSPDRPFGSPQRTLCIEPSHSLSKTSKPPSTYSATTNFSNYSPNGPNRSCQRQTSPKKSPKSDDLALLTVTTPQRVKQTVLTKEPGIFCLKFQDRTLPSIWKIPPYGERDFTHTKLLHGYLNRQSSQNSDS